LGQYRHHIFVCTSGKVCPRDGADAVHSALKKAVAEAGLKSEVRVNHAGCMNQCGYGPIVVVYPEDVWYAHVDVDAARKIVRKHVIGGEVLTKYLHVAPPGDNKIAE
jgi:(2Fe-2S) ferredoxin